MCSGTYKHQDLCFDQKQNEESSLIFKKGD